MNNYNVICLVCGAVNRNLYLEGTKSLMVCESCGYAMNLCNPTKTIAAVFKAIEQT